MTDILPDHSHCAMCDDPIPVGDEYCSDKCKAEHEAKAKKESMRMNYFYIAAVAAAIIIAVAIYYFGA